MIKLLTCSDAVDVEKGYFLTNVFRLKEKWTKCTSLGRN